jgi:hypothetical protein
LDDGSSNYEIKNNLCLNGGIKLREGFYRICENNIMVNNSLHPHVWYANSQDVFCRNIIFTEYRPIQVNQPWGKECDFNLMHQTGQTNPVAATILQQQSGSDAHSLKADAMFVNAAIGDFRVKEGSPALKLGFQNFPMNHFGVTSPRLKSIVRTSPMFDQPAAQITNIVWRGAVITDLKGGEYSVVGVTKDTPGVFLENVPSDSEAAKDGLRTDDFIQAINVKSVSNVTEFMSTIAVAAVAQHMQLGIIRDHIETMVTINGGGQPKSPAFQQK